MNRGKTASRHTSIIQLNTKPNQNLRLAKLASRISHAGLLSLAISVLIARSIGLMAKKNYKKQGKLKAIH